MFIVETRDEAVAFINSNGKEGRGARVKVPKSLKVTPNVVLSPKKSQQHRNAVVDERREIKFKKVSGNDYANNLQ